MPCALMRPILPARRAMEPAASPHNSPHGSPAEMRASDDGAEVRPVPTWQDWYTFAVAVSLYLRNACCVVLMERTRKLHRQKYCAPVERWPALNSTSACLVSTAYGLQS